MRTSIPLQVVLGGAPDLERGPRRRVDGRGRRAAADRRAGRTGSRPVSERRDAQQLRAACPKKTTSPPRSPGPGPMSSTRSAARMTSGIVLHDQQRVARVAQAVQHADQPVDVARVQADARLVEHEQRVDQRGAERGGEVDALHLAAAERAGLPVEGQVAQPDVDRYAAASGSRRAAGPRPRPAAPGSCRSLEEVAARARSAAASTSCSVQPAPGPRRHSSASGFSRAPAAGRAGAVGAVLREQHPDVHPVALGLQPVEEALRPRTRRRPPSRPRPPAPTRAALRSSSLQGTSVGIAAPPREAQQVVLAFAVALASARA